MRTDQEISIEISNLKDMKSEVRQSTAFGDNNHDAIDAQVEALEDQMDEDDVWERHETAGEDEPFSTEHERDAAIEAVAWMHGEIENPPSEDWADLIP